MNKYTLSISIVLAFFLWQNFLSAETIGLNDDVYEALEEAYVLLGAGDFGKVDVILKQLESKKGLSNMDRQEVMITRMDWFGGQNLIVEALPLAEKLLKMVSKNDKNYLVCLVVIIDASSELKDYQRAIEAYKKLMTLPGQKSYENYVGLGSIYYLDKNHSEAVKMLEAALKLDDKKMMLQSRMLSLLALSYTELEDEANLARIKKMLEYTEDSVSFRYEALGALSVLMFDMQDCSQKFPKNKKVFKVVIDKINEYTKKMDKYFSEAPLFYRDHYLETKVRIKEKDRKLLSNREYELSEKGCLAKARSAWNSNRVKELLTKCNLIQE